MPTFARVPIARAGWRETFRPAAAPSLEGFGLWGPAGSVAGRLHAAFTPRARIRGLLGRDGIGRDEALVIRPCSQVHTVGMRFPIDAVFCDRSLRVLHVATLGPSSVSRLVWRAACCIELSAGRAAEAGVEEGAELHLRASTTAIAGA